MKKLVSLIGLSAAVSFVPNFSWAQSVTLEPGFYNYSHVINFGGQDMPPEIYQYCVRPNENSRELHELVEVMSRGECELSNISMTRSTSRADISCTDTGLGLDIRGTFDANFGADFYDVDTAAALGPLNLNIKSKVRRGGECPVNWKNPDD